jgi:Protein of unknown function (DUF1593)
VRWAVALAAVAVLAVPSIASAADLAKPASQSSSRLIVISDIGNEPDDQMSLVRLLLYANEIDIEGLIASTSTWQRDKVSPEIMKRVIAAYGKVRGNLLLHVRGWPTEAALGQVVTRGQSQYGLAATGPDKMSAGARAIIDAADRKDDRPLWISIWGGANTLAQALGTVRDTRSPEALATFVAKLRVYSISDQDDAGPWIRKEFPGLFYVVKPSPPNGEEYASATWTGISGDAYYRNGDGADASLVTNEWLDKNIRSKGPLGAAYPKYMFIMEGDTPSFLGLIPNGLNEPNLPTWGGWGGRYVLRQPYGETRPIWTQGGDLFLRVTSADTVNGHTSDQATIWRWRPAYQNDFAARMDWTVKPFKAANHPPVPELMVSAMTLSPHGGTLAAVLDASGSTDPDGNKLSYNWFLYSEAGATADGERADISLKADGAKATVALKSPCQKAWIDGLAPCKGNGTAHIILAVTDDGTPALTRYRRFVYYVQNPIAGAFEIPPVQTELFPK